MEYKFIKNELKDSHEYGVEKKRLKKKTQI
jgi:hypothetical protein